MELGVLQSLVGLARHKALSKEHRSEIVSFLWTFAELGPSP